MYWKGHLRRNPFGGLDCDELLKTLEFVTLSYVHTARNAPEISRSGTISFPEGRHWLWLCSTHPSWAPARIQLRSDGFAVPVTLDDDSNARVHFPLELCTAQTDLGIHEVEAVLGRLGHPAELAKEILERVRGGFRKSFKGHDGFIDAVIVLMFGVHAGAKLSNCATSLMLLELTAGKHPCASPGSTHFGLSSLLQRGAGKHPTAAIQRDLDIMRRWLDFSELLQRYDQLSVKGRILKLLRTYLG